MKRLISAILLLLLLIPAQASAAEYSFIRVLGTNGTITAGVRTTPRGGKVTEWATEDLVEMVYTTDGVNWKKGTWDWEMAGTPQRGFYNGTEFLVIQGSSNDGQLDYRSEDGIHWTKLPLISEVDYVTCPPGIAEVGGYRFELKRGELYLLTGNEAALLPALGEAARKLQAEFSDVQAYPVPGGIRVEAYPVYTYPEERFVTVYPTSSLDWVRENQSTAYWDREELDRQDNEAVTIRKVAVGPDGERWEVLTDKGYNPITSYWCQDRGGALLLPWNGKSFLILDNRTLLLYASGDGVNWRCLRDTFLAPERDAGRAEMHISSSQHALRWTGTEYVACRRTAEIIYGMFGYAGGHWSSPFNTQICFADQDFNLTGSYDFGRQVLSVGYYDGTYYANVSNSQGVNEQEYEPSEGSTVFRSTDKVNWEKTDLAQIMSSIQTLA